MSRFVRELSGLSLGRVVARLAESAEPFEASALYSVSDEKRFVDEALRLSEFRTFRDAALFGLIKDIVDRISAADPRATFRLLENDITHIRYKIGGFFKQHADYQSLQVCRVLLSMARGSYKHCISDILWHLQSNVVEEYTLLLCVTPDGIDTCGGETRVTLNADTVLTSTATVTRGCGLLFRKDLAHEGLPVTAGAKEIVSVNIWAMRKVDAGAPLVHVRFCGRHVDVKQHGQTTKKSRKTDNSVLQSLADSRSYVISSSALADFPLVSLGKAPNALV